MKKNLFNLIRPILFASAMAIQAIDASADSTPPAITAQPTNAAVATGTGSYTFSVTATSSNLSYQWYQNGSPAGQASSTTRSLVLSDVGKPDAGSYTVVVTNDGGSVTSSVAVLVVQDTPALTNFTGTMTNIIAVGQLVTMTVQCSGDGLGFVWSKGATPLTGTNDTAYQSSYSLTNVSTGSAGAYTCRISNSVGSVTANFQLIAVPVPAVTTQPASKALGLGSNYTLSVTASGSYLHYFWNFGTNAVGADTNTLTITAAQYTNAGTYSVLVSNLAGTVTSSNAVITVQALPQITAQPAASSIVATNSALTLSVAATGDSLNYQWYKGASAIGGATSSNLVFGSIATSSAGTYSVVVSNLAAKVASSNAVVIPVVAPIITAQPLRKGLALGSNYTLSVTASGSYLHYFWSFGTNVVGADTNTLAITDAAYTNAGTYSVLVSNLAGTVTSSNSVITVQALPVITGQPTATNIVGTNSALTLTVTATGDGLAYQWYKGLAAIGGATSSNLLFSSVANSNAGTYSVVVSNFAAKVTSSNAVVIPVVAPVIVTQPLGKGLALGSNYTLSVVAAGSYLHYFWEQGTNLVGGDTNKLTITGADYTNAGTYSVLVSNLNGHVTSSNAVITVQALPAITAQPAATNIVATNSPLTLSVAATGDGLNYQWYKGLTAISGATSSNLVFSSIANSNAGTYSVVVSNLAAKVTSSNAVVIPVVGPVITTQPLGKGLALGSNYTLSVVASGSYLHYFWKNGTNLVGSDTNKFTITAADYTNSGTYSVLVSNLTGHAASSNAVITVQALPAITGQPTATNIVATNTALTLTVTATGDSLAYQWYKGLVSISGATSSNLVFSSIANSNAGTYSVVVSNLAAKVTSSNAVVIPVVRPVITTQPLGKGLALGSNYTMSVAATGSYLHYFWKNGTNLVGSDTNKFTISNAVYTNAGTYSVLVSNVTGTATSSNAVITVQTLPQITVQPNPTNTVPAGSNLSLTVTATGDALHYQWYKGITAVSGATNTSLVFTGIATSNAGTYSVAISNFAAKITSSNSVVVIVAAPVLTVAAPTVSVLQGASATLKVTASGTGPMSYQWSFPGTNLISGATNTNYMITSMTTNLAGTYKFTATNFGGTSATNITVNYVADTNPPVVVLTGANGSFTNSSFSIAGKATDNVAVSNVVFSLNGSGFSNVIATNGWTNFAISGTFTNVGTNTLIVKALDINGNWSVPMTNRPVYAPFYAVTISAVGSGTVSSNWTGKVQWGKTYSVTAHPGKNCVLVGWTGAVATNTATVQFSPTNSVTLTATFTTNVLIGFGGIYNGLFSYDVGGTNIPGYLTLTVSTNQTCSGKIYVGGIHPSLSGSFNTDGTLNITNSVTNQPTLTLNLSLISEIKAVVGTISTTNWASSNLEADLATFSASDPTTNAGTYTLVIPTDPSQGLGTGYGYGTVVVSSNGVITFVGAAADGTPVSQTTTLSQEGYWPFFEGLYPNASGVDRGVVAGEILFTNGLPAGYVGWGSPTTNGLAGSFTPIESSVFIKPATGVFRVFTNKLATITFSGAGLTNSFSEILAISDKGTVASDGAASVAISTSGLITGQMVDPNTKKTSKIYGIVLQHDQSSLGKGSIAGQSSIGNFVLTPYP